MRESLKNLFNQQIVLEDNSQFYYSIKPFELSNALGNVIAVLQEYSITKKDGEFFCKLYRTKEGNWYDISEETTAENNATLRALKSALDNKEEIPISS